MQYEKSHPELKNIYNSDNQQQLETKFVSKKYEYYIQMFPNQLLLILVSCHTLKHNRYEYKSNIKT